MKKILCFLSALTATSAFGQQVKQCCVCDGQGLPGVKIDASADCPKACRDKGFLRWVGLEACPEQPLNPKCGSDDGSFKHKISPKDLSGKCNIHLEISQVGPGAQPGIIQAKAGQEVTVRFAIQGYGGLGGGSCNVHSGGEVLWGDGDKTAFELIAIPKGDACSGPPFSRLGTNTYELKHTYKEPRPNGCITAWMQGDFKFDPNGGSYRCRAQRQEHLTVK